MNETQQIQKNIENANKRDNARLAKAQREQVARREAHNMNETQTDTDNMNTPMIQQSTLSEVNRGLCASANNARYRGTTKVWRISYCDDVTYAATTLWLANDFSKWLNETQYDGNGDPEMKFAASECGSRYRQGSAKLFPCF